MEVGAGDASSFSSSPVSVRNSSGFVFRPPRTAPEASDPGSRRAEIEDRENFFRLGRTHSAWFFPFRLKKKRWTSLALDLSELLDLKVVSALKSPETIPRTPATVRVITSEQIRDNGCLTLEDALADLPGFQFRNILGFNSYSFIRGVPGQNNKILLLVDGLQINELNSGGFYGGGQFNLAEVERIEVIYGPASALYGTNALSGIINIVTRDPRAGSRGRVSAGLGTFGARLADARYGYYDKNADFGFTAAAMLKRNEKADLAGAAGDFNWTEDIENFENDAAVQARVHFKDFEAGFLLQDENASRATVEKTAGEDLSIPWSDHGVNWHVRFINVWARYSYEKKKNWSFRNTAYYRNSTVRTIPFRKSVSATSDSPGRQFRCYRPNSLIGNETQVQWAPDPRWRFSAGLVLERERLQELIGGRPPGGSAFPGHDDQPLVLRVCPDHDRVGAPLIFSRPPARRLQLLRRGEHPAAGG